MDRFINQLKSDGVKITDYNKLKIYLEEKSVYRYSLIYEKLKHSNVSLRDEHLHDFYRYDIRVRRLLFKYLTLYEIKLRGKVLNRTNIDEKEVEGLDFGRLINDYYKNDIDAKAVKDLRNYVMHHRMIQLMPIEVVINGINSLAKKLFSKEKFFREIEMLSDNLELIYKFGVMKEGVVYGMGSKKGS